LQQTIVCKQFSFDAAHQLIGHKGKCANVHGHTYKLEVFAKGPVINRPGDSDDGFVIDFGDLKAIVKEFVVDPMDHSFLAQGDEPIIAELSTTGAKIYHLGVRSTCENMVKHIFEKLWTELPDLIDKIRLWETPTSYAETGVDDWRP